MVIPDLSWAMICKILTKDKKCNGPKKNPNVLRDCAVAEGEFMINKILFLMVSSSIELSADRD